MPRLTTEWLRAHGACQDGMRVWQASPYAATGCCLAAAVDVAGGEWSWLRWLYVWQATPLPLPVLCDLAASRARSVEHMWSVDRREACGRAVALAEAVAAGEWVSPRRFREADRAMAMPEAGWPADAPEKAARVARRALWVAMGGRPGDPSPSFTAMGAASGAASARQDPDEGWREALAELDAALLRAGL